jgi:2'-5' RNA ligase
VPKQPVTLPNWFLALPVNAPWLETLPALPPRFRRFDPADVHLTLMFLGACGETAARAALTATREALDSAPCSPFEVTLGDVVPMGPKKEYTALSALLTGGRDEVTTFMSRYRDVAADAANVRRDKRAPLPHITLGRPQRRATDVDREAGLAWATSVSLPGNTHVLDRVALYTWSDERRSALFRIVDSFPLTSR